MVPTHCWNVVYSDAAAGCAVATHVSKQDAAAPPTHVFSTHVAIATHKGSLGQAVGPAQQLSTTHPAHVEPAALKIVVAPAHVVVASLSVSPASEGELDPLLPLEGAAPPPPPVTGGGHGPVVDTHPLLCAGLGLADEPHERTSATESAEKLKPKERDAIRHYLVPLAGGCQARMSVRAAERLIDAHTSRAIAPAADSLPLSSTRPMGSI